MKLAKVRDAGDLPAGRLRDFLMQVVEYGGPGSVLVTRLGAIRLECELERDISRLDRIIDAPAVAGPHQVLRPDEAYTRIVNTQHP